jgi:NADPH-dependent 2,4-dienoyl-CoA reductase/sulfur reductase-like enzyme
MRYDVILVGGGPAGIISAVTARKYYPDKKILLIKSIEKGVIPCGIPYMFTTLDDPEQNAMGNMPLEKNKIDLKIDEVVSIDRDKRKIKTKGKETLYYEKLILATGSKPMMPPIEGIDKKGVYDIKKEMDYLKKLKEEIKKAKDIVIIGGGFIGIEFADELSSIGANVTVVELMPNILANSFDNEFSKLAKEKLIEKGIKIITGKKVVKFNGANRVESVLISDKTKIPCDMVILGIGALPNTKIAEKAGLDIGKSRGILVDEYLRTYSDDNIFAVGDCAEKKDFFTRKKIPIMLASTATAEARIAGANLFELKVVRENKGTIATYSTKIGDLTLGSAGLTEQTGIKEGFEIVVGNAEGVDKHPGVLPDAKKIKVKLIFSKQSGILLGGQVAGGDSAGEMVNIIGLALQKTTTLTELETLQIATHPKLTAAPTMYPIVIAAQDALSKIKR